MGSAEPSISEDPESPEDQGPPRATLSAEALACAMAVAPGTYSRNKMFSFFKQPDAKLARERASVMRSVVREFRRARGKIDALSWETEDEVVVLSYRIDALGYSRRVELSLGEAAIVRFLAAKANLAEMTASDADRNYVESTLARLMP